MITGPHYETASAASCATDAVPSKLILAQSAAVAQPKKGAKSYDRSFSFGRSCPRVCLYADEGTKSRISGFRHPLQFAPSRTSRARPTPAPPPASKFNRAERAIPNEYIVFLNDDTPTANVNTIINSLASAHGGLIKHNYSGFLKAFSVQMPVFNYIFDERVVA